MTVAPVLCPAKAKVGKFALMLPRLSKTMRAKSFCASAPRIRFAGRGLLPRTKSWFKDTLKLSRFLYMDAVLASLLINLIALGTPLFTMNV